MKRQGLFTEVDAYITGDRDPGLFVVSGKLCDGTDTESAIEAVEEQLRQVAEQPTEEAELQKVKNKYESTFVYSHYRPIDRAMSLCYYEWLGRLEWVNNEPQVYRTVTAADISRVAAGMFQRQRRSVLIYQP